MRKIAFISGSRADESPLSGVMQIVLPRLGNNSLHIRSDGLFGHEKDFKEVLEEFKPDMAVLLGDRYETLVAASVAALLCIPIAHIHGGEETEGAVDNQFRHAITKLSYYHFCAHADYAKRIIQMGESPDRVFVTGAPGVDQYAVEPMTQKEIEAELGIRLIPPVALVCYHPETLGDLHLECNFSGSTYIVSGANCDPGGEEINRIMKSLCNGVNSVFRQSYGHLWTSLMHHADVLIGNSSCFIIEGMTLGKKVINIGDRQKGRYEDALRHFAADKYAYGKPGEVGPRIANLLMTLPIPEKPRKAWHDINF